MQFKAGEKTKKVEVKIIDDDGWEPDENFFIELYDPNQGQTGKRLPGQDTRTVVTIIDDDKPGHLSFARKLVPVLVDKKEVEIFIDRKDGNDGEITFDY